MSLPATPSACLRSIASVLRSLPRASSPSPWLAYPQQFITTEVPELLTLSAKVLSRSPLPLQLGAWPSKLASLKVGEWLKLASTLGCGLLLLSYLLAALIVCFSRRAKPARSYWLTRVLLVRGMGVIYFAAFATSAAQSRALFGSIGLDPVLDRPSGRPAPAFDLMLGRTDLALEAVSWLGVLLSLLVAGGVLQWAGVQVALWIGYLSIVNLAPRVVIGATRRANPFLVNLVLAILNNE